MLAACATERKSETTGEARPAPTSSSDAARILEQSRALDNSRDSSIKIRARISAKQERAELNAPSQVELTIFRKRQPDGRQSILIQITAPPEERDRDGLITTFPDGRVEVLRYMQSTDSFLVSSDPTAEDSLFGLTPQELAEGQPEKYDFTAAGEETRDGTPAYRLEGKLKQGAESKFPRVLLVISKQDLTILGADFFDNRNQVARRMSVQKTEQVDGHWTRKRWTIDNLARSKTIEFEAVEARYDQNLADAIFTREHLKKIASR